jgi:hypothetical protein
MVVILSPRSAASSNVADEVSVALDGQKHIIPILIEPCTPPLRMTRMQFLDATKDFDEAVRRCLTTIRRQAGEAEAPREEAGPTAPGLSGDVLQDAKRRLTGFMGPISGVLVRQAAGKASNRLELYEELARSIANPLDRKSFLDWATDHRPAGQVVTPRTTRIPEGPPAPGRITTEEVEAIISALKPYLGPIAAQLVARERQAADSREGLCQRLSLRISGEKERLQFLRTTRAE